MTLGKVYEWSKFKKLPFNKIRLSLNFENTRIFFINPLTLLLLFYNVYKEKMFTIQIEDGREAPRKPSLYMYFACLSGCLSVCVQKTSKLLKRVGSNFVWDLTWPRQGMFMDTQNYKKLYPCNRINSLRCHKVGPVMLRLPSATV